MDNPRYYDESVRLLPGERFFLYTDGLADQWMEEPGDIIEDTNIINIIKDNSIDLNIALNLIARYVYKQLDTIGAKQRDDVTMALIQPLQNEESTSKK